MAKDVEILPRRSLVQTPPRRPAHSSRDLQAICETVGPYLSERQVGQAIEYLLRLAGRATTAPVDLEKSREGRELGKRPW
jgi:hypothetical protein